VRVYKQLLQGGEKQLRVKKAEWKNRILFLKVVRGIYVKKNEAH
jgi:hypothetical protein